MIRFIFIQLLLSNETFDIVTNLNRSILCLENVMIVIDVHHTNTTTDNSIDRRNDDQIE